MITAQPQGPTTWELLPSDVVIAFEMAQQHREEELAVGLWIDDGISLVRSADGAAAETRLRLRVLCVIGAHPSFSLPAYEVRRLSGGKRGLTTYCQSEASNLLGPEQDINWVRRFLKGIAARTRASRSDELACTTAPYVVPFNPSRP